MPDAAPMVVPSSAGRGRPRSEQAHRAILDATAALLAEHGFSALRLEHVAARAGVGKATIYRRWSSREALALELLTQIARTDTQIPDLGDTRRELVRWVAAQARALSSPPLGPVLRTLLSQIACDEALAASFRTEIVRAWHDSIAAIVARGIERGDIRADADPALAEELLLGPLVFRLVFGGPLDEDLAERLVAAYLTGAAPAIANEDWF
jgi:AcrR family transcriptional regulator